MYINSEKNYALDANTHAHIHSNVHTMAHVKHDS